MDTPTGIDLRNATFTDIGKIVDEAIYKCYKYNRDRSPDISPSQWSMVLNNVNIMELRYQGERGGF